MDNTLKYKCRVCKKNTSYWGMIPLSDGDTRQLFKECTNIDVHLEDNSPQQLCDGCHGECVRWRIFKNRALATDCEMRKVDDRIELDEDWEMPYLQSDSDDAEEEDRQITAMDQHLIGDSIDGDEQAAIFPDEINEIDSAVTPSHDSASHNREWFICSQCGWSLSKESELRHPERIHKGEFLCEECGKTFLQQADLDHHKTNPHLEDKPSECDEDVPILVDGLANDEKWIMPHLESDTDQDDEEDGPNSVTKKDSTASTNDEDELDEISQNEDEEGDSVDTPEPLAKTGLKKFRCKECDRSFLRKYHLIRHERIHTGEKPFSCNVCSKTFTRKGDLIVHKRIHTGEKPYKCDKCGKAFNHSSTLKRHKLTHAKKRQESRK